MTFYPSETEIAELARRAQHAAAEVVGGAKRKPEHPEDLSWPLEYKIGKDAADVFWALFAAITHAEQKYRPVESRKKELEDALAKWTAWCAR